jgi:pimeloyl-ACP methyl ester carboxylesterase
MRETWRRRALALTVVVLTLAGFAAAQAAESEPEDRSPTDQLGNVWYADPLYTPAGVLATATWEAPTAIGTAQAEVPADLPAGIPDAARASEPLLPSPGSWTYGDGFPRTSGSGRYANGAYFWSDFIYDDNGAIGVPPPTNESSGAPGFGTYKYPATEPEAMRNGADIFRVAIGRRGAQTTWRVDWNTLTDADYPMAVFTIDSDPTNGVEVWPANARLKSPGIDYAVLISGKSASILDLVHGTTSSAQLDIDMDARSFVATTTDIPVNGSAVVRVAAGLADGTGTGLRTLDPDHGAAQDQPNVYNVAFRDYADEPSVTNTWYDTTQARTLAAGGDVSAFAATVNWDDLGKKRTDPERLLPGLTNRWYVSSLELGQGIAEPGEDIISTSGDPLYVGRIQPYSIFVPTSYRADSPSSLTWMLHGALSSHNSIQVHPRFLESACEDRNSICVSPLGRGPEGGWRTSAELDFWEVWNRVASAYTLDPHRTILSGVSMGAFGTYKIAMDHPEAFEAAVSIVGHANDIETGLDRLTNLRWMPLYARHGTADELVPIPDEIATQDALNAQGLRHVYDFQPVEDHIVVALKDAYDDIAEFMANIDKLDVVTTPPVISFALKTPYDPEDPEDLEWREWRDFEEAHGLNRPGAWWVSDVARRVPRDHARIEATSHAIGNPPVTAEQRDEARLLGSPTPTLRHILEWQYGEVPDPWSVLDATLTNIGALTIDLVEAELASGTATLNINSEHGPVTITLAGLGHRKLTVDEQPVRGTNTITLSAGPHVILVG